MFGDKLRDQVEERLPFYETGEVPRKNVDVMKDAMKEVCSVVFIVGVFWAVRFLMSLFCGASFVLMWFLWFPFYVHFAVSDDKHLPDLFVGAN